jgi:hypothetical protein
MPAFEYDCCKTVRYGVELLRAKLNGRTELPKEEFKSLVRKAKKNYQQEFKHIPDSFISEAIDDENKCKKPLENPKLLLICKSVRFNLTVKIR